jgi:hypothetical protein
MFSVEKLRLECKFGGIEKQILNDILELNNNN